MNRRRFIQSAAVLGLAATRVLGANDRIRVGLIGCGARGQLVGKLMAQVPNVEFAALCDVYHAQIPSALEWAGQGAKIVKDFRRVLEMKDIDAVVVATPDHWHAIPTVLACQAGKHVYVEKPLAHNIVEGRKIVEAARRHKRIVQVGTQHRAAPHYAEAAELIRSGALGPIHFVRIWNYVNMHPRGIGPAEDSDPPTGVDWDFYLGPAPERPFNKNRFIKTYRWFWDYAGGLATDFGTHRFDSMHQLMNVDAPLSVNCTGGRFALNDGAETPDFIQATFEYPNFVMSYEASMLNSFGIGKTTPGHNAYGSRGEFDRPHGEAFYGSNATLISTRTGYEIIPEPAAPSGPGATENTAAKPRAERKIVNGADRTDLHAQNFIDAIRNNAKLFADPETGHRSSNIPHLANISFRVGRKIKWDAKTETIANDPEATKLLYREPRKKWDLI